MPRSRNIKPGFFKNEYLAEVTPHARLLFIGLWLLADREGRLEDRPRKIRAELFPFEDCDVPAMLVELEEKGFLHRYILDNADIRHQESYIQVFNFVKHQDPHYKEKASEIPPPPGMEDQVAATNVTRTQRARILKRDGYTCQNCKAEEHLCIDHVIPVSRGGDSSDENLRVLCQSCNAKKSNKLDGEAAARKRDKDEYGDNFNPKLDQGQGDVESRSGQQKGPSPSSPLIPDSLSLIPDSGEGQTRFDQFWKMYPNKVKKKPSQSAFLRLSEPDQLALLEHLPTRIKDKGFQDYTPHPTTFINQRRWEDENWQRVNNTPTRDLTDNEVLKLAQKAKVSTAGKSRSELLDKIGYQR